MTTLTTANMNFREGNLFEAIRLWRIFENELPDLSHIAKANIEIAKARLEREVSHDIDNRPKEEKEVRKENDDTKTLSVLPKSIGNIDIYQEERVYGWASLGKKNNIPSTVFLYVDGSFAAQTKAVILRADLQENRHGDGRKGFIITVPKKFIDCEKHLLEIRPAKERVYEKGQFKKISKLEYSHPKFKTLYNREKLLFPDRRRPIMFVGHNAEQKAFGGELSFIDLLKVVDRRRYRIIVSIPYPSDDYLKKVLPFADVVEATPKHWWLANSPIKEQVILDYQSLIQKHNVQMVYANTIMLREPLIAAQREHVRTVCHVRELIDRDRELQEKIGEPPGAIIREIKKHAEYIVANSDITRVLFNKPKATFLVYNGVELKKFEGDPDIFQRRPFRVGMLSSNLLKKGIADFVGLAKAAKKEIPDVIFTLVGPITEDVESLKEQLVLDKDPPNIEFPGYVSDPKNAIDSFHVLINFSHFAESFGRTVAEAMAAGRPVIAYAYGALPELVKHGETGYLINYRKPLEALGLLKNLAQSSELYNDFSRSARLRVERLFSHDVLRVALNATVEAVLQAEVAPEDGIAEVKATFDVAVVVPNYNYARFLPERIGSIINQSYPPSEIIFLDDASTDDSVEVAKNLLLNSPIPYKIFMNKSNAGIYLQWLKGIRAAKSEWVWIAEADDSCDPKFLSVLLAKATSDVGLIYCQSKRIDSKSIVTEHNNLNHTQDISRSRWLTDYKVFGRDEIALGLGFRNTIPNVSATLIRRSLLMGVEDALVNFASCGDWWLYAHILRKASIAYVSESLNYFRRHASSQTAKIKSTQSYLDEISTIHNYIAQHYHLLPKEVNRFSDFVRRDYKVEGVSDNLSYPLIAEALRKSLSIAGHRKRIAFITTNNGSWTGGSEVLWRDAAHRLALVGHDVVALVRQWAPKPDIYAALESVGVRIYYKKEGGLATLLELEPDMVVISTGDQDEGVEYFSQLIERKIPFAIVNQLTKDPRYWKIRTERTPMLQKAYRAAGWVSFTSRNNLYLMQERLGFELKNATVHFNPFHIKSSESIPSPPTENGYRIAVPAKILFVHKGQDLLVPILSNEKWKRRDLFVDFYGEGPDEDFLVDKMRMAGVKNVMFHGRVPNVTKIWESCHAILMPSRMEGMPIVLISAMVAGRVPIVTDIGGAAEVVEDGRNGFIAKSPEVVEIDNALERAWLRRSEWVELGLAARSTVLKYLSNDPVKDFIERIEVVFA